MTFSPSHFYGIAERLQVGRPIAVGEEATSRTVAGRIYYAAFIATRETLRTMNKNPSYHPGHEPLTQFLKTYPGEPEVQKVGERLEGLRKQRQNADYELELVVGSRAVGTSMQDAKAVLDAQPLLLAKLSISRFPPHGRG